MKRFLVALIGGTVVLLGVVMIVLPGPALVVIPAGVAILATEFYWAKRWMAKGRGMLARWKIARANGLSRRAALRLAWTRPSCRRAET